MTRFVSLRLMNHLKEAEGGEASGQGRVGPGVVTSARPMSFMPMLSQHF